VTAADGRPADGHERAERERADQVMAKRAAGERAVEFVESGMAVGLGTGSTAVWATRRIGELLRDGRLRDVAGFPTSAATEAEARRLGIPLLPSELPFDLDLTIDGADEVDPALDLIKGRGGALLHEKTVAQASRRVIIVVDEGKRSSALGTKTPLPVEVTRYAWRAQVRFLESLGARVTLRAGAGGEPFVTDEGNLILDCELGPIADLRALAARLDARAGIVEHGLFLGLATDVIVAGAGGIQHLTRGT
jgi:ribose 5-phosphate isomerase A